MGAGRSRADKGERCGGCHDWDSARGKLARRSAIRYNPAGLTAIRCQASWR